LKNRTVSAPRFGGLYREAGERLSQNGNRLLLIEAWIIALILVPLYTLLLDACSLFPVPIFGMDGMTVFVILALVITWLLTLPYLLGILKLGCLIERGEDAVLSDVFFFFSSQRAYGKALLLSFGILWKLWLIFDLAAGIWYLALTFAPGNLVAAIFAVLLIICEVLLGLLLCLLRFPYLCVAIREDRPWRESRKIGRAMARACPASGMVFFLGYVPWIILGILSVGVLLLIDVLPRMCVSYFRYCNKINESILQSEDESNE